MENNIYKPRYKIAFLSKSKVWPYKNSRLRRFFNIRGRKLVRRGLFKRYFLVFNNMKWTVARRYIRPYRIRRSSGTIKKRYKTAFYNKQQLRHFYGKFKEETFRNFFRASLVGINNRNNSYYSALERRADMFLFRTRVLPTIYAANQFVHHQGVELNGFLEKSPHALVRPGAVLTFQPKYWNILAEELYVKLEYRLYGNALLLYRTYKKLKKKIRWLSRRNRRKFKKKYFKIKKYLSLRKKIRKKLIPKIKTLKSRYEQNLNLDYLYKIFANNLWQDCHLPKGNSLKIFYEMLDLYMSEAELEALTNLKLDSYSKTYNKLGLKLWYLLKEVRGASLKKVKIKSKASLKKYKLKKNLPFKKDNKKKGHKGFLFWRQIANVRKFLKVKKWKLAQAKFFKSVLKLTNLYKKVLEISVEIKFLEINYRIAFIKSILIRENVLKKININEKYLLIKRFLSYKYVKKVPFKLEYLSKNKCKLLQIKQWKRNLRFKRQSQSKITKNKAIRIKISYIVKQKRVWRNFKSVWPLTKFKKLKTNKLREKKLTLKKHSQKPKPKLYFGVSKSRWQIIKMKSRKTCADFSWSKAYLGKKTIRKVSKRRNWKSYPLKKHVGANLKILKKAKRDLVWELKSRKYKKLTKKEKIQSPQNISRRVNIRDKNISFGKTITPLRKCFEKKKRALKKIKKKSTTYWIRKYILHKKKPNIKKQILQVFKFLNSEEKVLERKNILVKAKEVLSKYKKYLVTEKQLYFLKITKLWEPYLQRRIRYRKWLNKRHFNIATGEREKVKELRRTGLYYALAYRKYKLRRKVSIIRLKSVHWYIPSYIHFDFPTMTAIFLHHPLSKEITYSFKCSLPKIHAFYRSKGY